MAQNILPIAAASLISMLAGVALSLVFTAEALDTLPDDVTEPLQEVAQEMRATQSRLARIEKVLARELAATRRDVQAIAAGGQRVSPSGSGATPPRSAPSADDVPAHVARGGSEPMPIANLRALEPLATWSEDKDLRSKWMFTAEADSLQAFGAPDEITTRGPAEWWVYWNIAGDKITSEYRLKFNHGRLVEASRVKWEKPRRLPGAKR